MNNNPNQKRIEEILNSLSQKVSSGGASQAPTNADIQNVLSKLEKKQADKIKNILNDPDATREILNSPQAQAIIKKFSGKKD